MERIKSDQRPVSLNKIFSPFEEGKKVVDGNEVSVSVRGFLAKFVTEFPPMDNWSKKTPMVQAILKDNRVTSQQIDFLLDNFIPKDIHPLSVRGEHRAKGETQEELAHVQLGETIKQELAIEALRLGRIDTHSKYAKEAMAQIAHEFQNRPDIQVLVADGMPPEQMAQLITIERFNTISDEEKLEELRAWVTRSIYREYLGAIKGRLPKRSLNPSELVDLIPKQIFDNPEALRMNLVLKYLEDRYMQRFTELISLEGSSGLQKGLDELDEKIASTDNPGEREFLKNLAYRFYAIATDSLQVVSFGESGIFKSQIQIKGEVRNFPSFEQRAFCYDFQHNKNNKTRLLSAETGMGKTATAYLAMENSHEIAGQRAQKVLILAPAGGKRTWEIEAEKVFVSPHRVKVINSTSDIPDFTNNQRVEVPIPEEKYIVISSDLLKNWESNPDLRERLLAFIEKSGIDGAVVDEIDDFNDSKAKSVKALKEVIDRVKLNYEARCGEGTSLETPIIGLTATPIRTGLSDLDFTMAILYPEDYGYPGSDGNGNTSARPTFSNKNLKRPDLAYIELFGERRIFRWEQAKGVQEFSYEPHYVDISPFENYLYDFVLNNVEEETLGKFRLLENVLFNPLLVKKELQVKARNSIEHLYNGAERQGDLLDLALDDLKKIVMAWKKYKGWENGQIPDVLTDTDRLSTSRLVELGFGDMALRIFFHDAFENGMDTLVSEMTKGAEDPNLDDLGKLWKAEPISSKYREVEKILKESLTWREGEKGLYRDKVFIVSPSRAQARTVDVEQRMVSSGEEETPLYTDYELATLNDKTLVKQLRNWVEEGNLCKRDDVLVIDGSVPVEDREAIINRWVNDPDAAVLLVTLEATYQSRDLTLTKITDGKNRSIRGVRKVFLGPPWYYQQLKQMGGRSIRLGQKVPVSIELLIARDLIDAGKAEAVLYTQLLTRMALTGIRLNPDEQAFFDKKRIGGTISVQNPEAVILRDLMRQARDAGEEEVERLLSDTSAHEERTNYQLVAEKFYDEGNDAYKTTGYNAQMVANLIEREGLGDSSILSVGAGTLLLQRALKRGIDNLDLNPAIMQKGWDEASQYGGRRFIGRASNISKIFDEGSYQVVDGAFILDWTKLLPQSRKADDSERAKILSNINSVLGDNGLFILTVQERAFNQESFGRFASALEKYFGFEIQRELSGETYGISEMGSRKRLGWTIIGRKTGKVDIQNLDLRLLQMETDSHEWRSDGKIKKRKGKSMLGLGKDYPVPDFKLKINEFAIVDPATRSISAFSARDFDERIRIVEGETLVDTRTPINFQPEVMEEIPREEVPPNLQKGETTGNIPSQTILFQHSEGSEIPHEEVPAGVVVTASPEQSSLRELPVERPQKKIKPPLITLDQAKEFFDEREQADEQKVTRNFVRLMGPGEWKTIALVVQRRLKIHNSKQGAFGTAKQHVIMAYVEILQDYIKGKIPVDQFPKSNRELHNLIEERALRRIKG